MTAGTFIFQDPNSFPDYGNVGVFLPCIHILWGYIMSGGTNNLGEASMIAGDTFPGALTHQGELLEPS